VCFTPRLRVNPFFGKKMTQQETNKAEADETLDLRGLKCPLPALYARRALLRSGSGKVVEVVADDPLAYIDIPHMCRQEAIEVMDAARDGDLVRLLLRR
jgi:tRNA 2-thiouridine synthesizing protein A